MEGYENELRTRIEAENQGEGKELSRLGLARRPRWGGGALRAFRRAEIIFNAVLFESWVGGVAGAIAVASIFLLEFRLV